MVSGKTLRISFIGIPSAEGGATVTALTAVNGEELASTTSAGNGDFTLAITTGGSPIAPVITVDAANALTSVFVPDEPLDHDQAGLQAFFGSATAVGSLYSLSPVSRDSMLGTVFVRVVDCDDNPVSGATIALSPAPEDILYAGANGFPSGSANETSSSGFAWALNVPTGSVELTATKPGTTFIPYTFEVLAGNHFMGGIMHPVSM